MRAEQTSLQHPDNHCGGPKLITLNYNLMMMTMMMGMMGMIRIVWSLAKLAPSPLPHKIPRKNRGQK